MAYLKPNYKMCENCNRLIKIKGNNTQYCKVCAKQKEIKSKEERNKKYYQNHKENKN